MQYVVTRTKTGAYTHINAVLGNGVISHYAACGAKAAIKVNADISTATCEKCQHNHAN